MAFLKDKGVKDAKLSARQDLGTVEAALVSFSSCAISNGCAKTFLVSQALQSGDRVGPNLVKALVTVAVDANGEESVRVELQADKPQE